MAVSFFFLGGTGGKVSIRAGYPEYYVKKHSGAVGLLNLHIRGGKCREKMHFYIKLRILGEIY